MFCAPHNTNFEISCACGECCMHCKPCRLEQVELLKTLIGQMNEPPSFVERDMNNLILMRSEKLISGLVFDDDIQNLIDECRKFIRMSNSSGD